jgi:hypothetical protein
MDESAAPERLGAKTASILACMNGGHSLGYNRDIHPLSQPSCRLDQEFRHPQQDFSETTIKK